jgi:hypothetical protein
MRYYNYTLPTSFAANFTAMWPKPPMPATAHSAFGVRNLFKGAKTVMPAHNRGGHTFSGMLAGIGTAQLAGSCTWEANPPNKGVGVNLTATLGQN